MQGAQQRPASASGRFPPPQLLPQNGLRPGAVWTLRTGSLQVNTLTGFFLTLIVLPLRTRLSMQLGILALRHQLAVYQQSGVRPRIKPVDRLFCAWLSKVWSGWRDVLVFVQPRTVIAWQRKRFREHWARISGKARPGRYSTRAPVRWFRSRKSAACIIATSEERLDEAICIPTLHLRTRCRDSPSCLHPTRQAAEPHGCPPVNCP